MQLRESQFSIASLQVVPETPQTRVIRNILDDEVITGKNLLFKSPTSTVTQCTEQKPKRAQSNI